MIIIDIIKAVPQMRTVKNKREEKTMQTTTKTILLLLLILGFCVPKANAEQIEIRIAATVYNMFDDGNFLGGQITNGSIITGSYVYESTTPDLNPLDPVQGNYRHYSTPAGVFLTVGGFEFKTDPTNVEFDIFTRNNIPEDRYGFASSNNLPLSESVGVGSIFWTLINSDGSVLSSDALPTTVPVLNLWQENDLMITGGGWQGETWNEYGIHAVVTSAELVPEPGTFLLLTLGAFAIRKCRRFQN